KEKVAIEIDQLTDLIRETIPANQGQRELLRALRDRELLGRLMAFTMSSADWEKYLRHHTSILALAVRIGHLAGRPLSAEGDTALPRAVRPFENFCRLAERRSGLMASNLQAHVAQSARPAVLIAGGFHTHGISSALTKLGVSYAVITPRLDH